MIKKKENKLLGLFLFLAVFALLIFLLCITKLYFEALDNNPFDFSKLSNEENRRSALGALGDYFGGLLNALFAFLSFIGVLWTLRMSRQELDATNNILDAQLKTQLYQRADSCFSVMFEKLLDAQAAVIQICHDFDQFGPEKNLFKFQLEIKDNVVVMKYFRLLFQTFFMLDQILKETDQGKKKLAEYAKVIRSQQDEVILEILLIYISEKIDEQTDFHQYLKLSNFFKHLQPITKQPKFDVVLEIYHKFQLIGESEFFTKNNS